MATDFDRWEKDPFFPAAEEVQDSADRMESTYRKWVLSEKDKSTIWNSDEISRDLQTALGTAKWQLDDFERAINSSYTNNPADDAKDRHREFAIAIDSQIKKVESSLNKSAVSQGKPPMPWVRLDERECNELALFLSGPSTSPGFRRTASASADIGALKIAVADDVPTRRPKPPPRKVPSFSGFLNGMEFATQLKFSRNGYRKPKVSDSDKKGYDSLPDTQQWSRDINKCYEKSKRCLDSSDKCFVKRLYGVYGAIQRQLQKSQYYMQYSRSIRVVLLAIFLLSLIVLLVLQTMRGARSPLLQQ